MAHVFTIPAPQNFVETLALGILKQVGDTPEKLAPVTVLLPTRRACRALREAFLRLSDGKPMLLPNMTPLGDVDEDELALSNQDLDFLPAIGGMKRTVQLAQFVMKMNTDTTLDQAVRLAEELAQLVDQVHTEGLDLARLPDLVHDKDLSKHWQKTVQFLSIVGETWPAVLHEQGVQDLAARRNDVLRARAQNWQDNPPLHPVIAAGSTGSIPATADLLNVIAHLPHGAVVLPGLDQDVEPQVWQDLDSSHPQYGMAKLLKKLAVDRHDVRRWNDEKDTTDLRGRLINRALVPAPATPLWRDDPLPLPDVKNGLNGLARIDCPGPREEAETIALLLREALNTPRKTAALITPDRSLARRVSVELKRWDIDVDDSAGQPLDQTPAGTFFNLVADMTADGFHPISVLACLKHPLAAGGMNPQHFRFHVRALEAVCLRGPRPGEGLKGLEDRLRVFHNAPQRHAQNRLDRMGLNATHARAVLAMLQDAADPLAQAFTQPHIDPADLLKQHVTAAVALARTDAEHDERRLWSGESGEALSIFINEAHEALSALGPIVAEQYPALIKALMAGRAVRPAYGKHPRVFIWGLLEARLQRADVTVLGGLNEGSWPAEVEASPWMSRPMMQAFGLALPERRIGLAAHDFAQAAMAPCVYLTRSERSGTSPQVPSRWLVRLDTMLGETPMPRAQYWQTWAQDLYQSDGPPKPCARPKPTPPVSARPRKLSVTAIEKLRRDPYAIYAQRILRLQALDPIDADASAADRGTVIHTVLERIIKTNKDNLGADFEAELLTIGEQVFKKEIASPGVRAFWWPRFKRIVTWFADFEATRRAQGFNPVVIEDSGLIKLDGFVDDFFLTATADRIDLGPDGGIAIIDYKTGMAATTRQVKGGFAPQLPLEALMAKRGAFNSLNQRLNPADIFITAMLYVRLTGGRVPGEIKRIDVDGNEAMEQALVGLTKLIHKFDIQDTPYLSRPRPMFTFHFDEYDHLARVKEWQGEGDLE